MYSCTVRPTAVARIKGGHDAPGLSGEVRFYQECRSVLVVANISNLPPNSDSGFFALHIHEGGNCSGVDFPNTGSHYDPSGEKHPKHAGDLPPLMLCNGGACLAVRTDRFCVRDVIGRTVMIHSGPDDFHTQPAGNSGDKIACGVICQV